MYHGHYDSHGLSVFAPLTDKFAKKMGEYGALDFNRDTGWGDYVTSLQGQLKAAAEVQGHTVARPEAPPAA